MLLDRKMDHGPIIAQEEIILDEWLPNRDMELWFASEGAELFSNSISPYLAGELLPEPQDHDMATYCDKYTKQDMEVSLNNPRDTFLRYCAFPKPFFFEDNKRVIINKASWLDETLHIESVTPEGKKNMHWDDYQKMVDNKK